MSKLHLPALALRNASGPLLSDKRHLDIDVAKYNIDYDNAQAVREAHRQMTHMGPLDRFCDWAFHCGDKARCLNAFTALILYRDAEEKNRTTRHIAPSREVAYKTLAESISSTGQATLLCASDASAIANEFTRYLSPADRLCLAGWVNVRYAHNQNNPALYAKSAEAFGQAASAHAAAQRPLPAAEAYVSAGHAHAGVGAIAAATNVRMQAAFAFLRVHQHDHAAQPYMQAARGYLLEGKPSAAGHAYARAGACYVQIGESYRSFAIGAFKESADAFERANDLESAAESLEAMGHIYSSLAADEMCNGAYGGATYLALSAEDAFARAGRREELATAQLMVANAFEMRGRYVEAARSAEKAATAFADLELHQQAAKIWARVSQLYARAWWLDDSKRADSAAERAQARVNLRAAPDAELRERIRAAIAARLDGFKTADDNTLESGPHKIIFNGESVVHCDPFDEAQDVEWCLLSSTSTLTHLFITTADEATRLINKRWRGDVVQDSFVIRGTHALAIIAGRPAEDEHADRAARISEAIAARLAAFSTAARNGLVSGEYEIFFANGMSASEYLPFRKHDPVEWCLLRRSRTARHLDLVTVDEANRLLGKPWLGSACVHADQVIRGEAALALLRAARSRVHVNARRAP